MSVLGGFTATQWIALAGYELMLFAGFFFMLGALDDIAVDLCYLWLKVTGAVPVGTADRRECAVRPLAGRAVVMIPAWQEEDVIGATIAHALRSWRQDNLRLYVGCYRNDEKTLAAAMAGAAGDPRVRLVIHDSDGPTSKADCLNRIYAAMCDDEQRDGVRVRMVLLHDAEDMVDPAALALLDAALDQAEFVQLPVLPEPQSGSPWIAGHYCDEFAEAHGKLMVVREALGAGLPAAGVGCAFSREALAELAERDGRRGMPFASECLTEDYELGLRIAESGGRTRFLRVRGEDGRLVATRACFPNMLVDAVRQKTRWIHGIAFQGWERLGWHGGISERWMRYRDRRSPLTALVLVCAYLLLIVATLFWLASLLGLIVLPKPDPVVMAMLMVNLLAFSWRAVWRFAMTTREYGLFQGALSLPRIVVANVISIMAGRRAMWAYLRSLQGMQPVWEKTRHHAHPVLLRESGAIS